jgi:PAS domain S-box-containing protein
MAKREGLSKSESPSEGECGEDMTERERAERMVSESEQRFRSLIEETGVGVAIIDLTGTFTYVNGALAELLGYSVAELCGRRFSEFLHSDDIENVTKLFLKAISSPIESETIEFRVMRRDGRILHLMSKPTRNMIDGRTVGFQAIIIDITERKRVEEALRRSEAEYRAVVESQTELICRYKADGTFTFINEAYCRYFGKKPEELIGHRFMPLPPEDRENVRKKLASISPDNPMVTYEQRVVLSSGEVRWQEWTDRGIFDDKLRLVEYQSVGHDITERKRAEEELRRERDRAQTYLDVAGVMMLAIDAEGQIILLNRRGCEILGCSAQEAVGKSWVDNFIPPATRDEVKAVWKSIMEGKLEQVEYHENPVLTSRGEERVMAWQNTPLKDAEGRIIGILSSGNDITERKRVEDALRTGEENFKALAENAFDGILIATGEGVHVYANERAAEITGYSVAELLRTTIKELAHPDESEKMLERYRRRLEGEDVRNPVETVITRKDGRSLPIELAGARTIWQHKPVDMVFIRDITERKRMQDEIRRHSAHLEELVFERTKKLAESERRFRELSDLLPQIVFEIDENGNVEYMNRAGFAATGLSEEEFSRGLSAFHFLAPAEHDRATRGIQRVIAGEAIGEREFTVLRKDGIRFPALVYTAPIIREGKTVGLRGIAVDITQRKRAEEELAKSQRLATIGELAAIVGHDLRNPLTGIAGATYNLRRHLGRRIDSETREALEIIEQDIQHSDKIINDLLEYSKEIHLDLREASAKSITKDALAHAKIPAKIRMVDSTQNQPKILIDADKMRRVFVNLIKNAVDAMPKGGTLRITSKKTDSNLEIIFADTGTGMTKEAKEKIWSPLFTTKATGIGLGLPIAKSLVEAHGGSITAESKAGKGSSFTVTLPIRSNSESKEVRGKK